MMTTAGTAGDEDVARLPVKKPDIVPALERLCDEVRRVCPADAAVALRFDGKLHVEIDVRSLDQAMLVEHVLPVTLGGALHDIRRAKSPHSFFHRITAELDV
jgi:hypothetical protein